MIRVAVAALLVASCSQESTPRGSTGPPDLESAAIARGLVTDPETVALAGLYSRGTDRMCIVEGAGESRIGAFVDYGDGVLCSDTGTVERRGEILQVALGNGCTFEARYDGDRIAFPGVVPQACAATCDPRASFAGMVVERLSDSRSEAAALRDPRGRLLCGTASPDA